MADLSKKSLAELRSEFVDLGNQLSVIAGSRQEYDVEIRARLAKAAARAKVSGLNKSEKDSLREVLSEP